MTDDIDRGIDQGRGPDIGGPQGGYTSRPVPDPTILTTQALYREVAALKELIEQRIAALNELVQVQCDSLTQELHVAIASRDQLDDVKADKVQQQFTLMEQQRREQKSDTQAAVQAALTAQKEAITKSEASTTKQIDQMGTTFSAALEARTKATDDQKDRLLELERTMRSDLAAVDARRVDLERQMRADLAVVDAKANAGVEQKRGAREDRSGLYAAVAALGGLIIIGLTVVGFLTQR